MKKREELEKLVDTREIRDNELKVIETKLAKTDLEFQAVHKAERVKIVAMELLRGVSPHDIAERYHEEWGLAFNVVRLHYTIDARKFLAENLVTEEHDIRNDLLAKYYYLYSLAIKEKDFKEAHSLLNSISKLTQTFVQHVNVFGNINTIQLVEVLRDHLNDEQNGNSTQA